MSKLEELIQKYCPDGVEYVNIKDVCIKICSGGTPSRGNGDYFTGNIPWLRTQEVDFKDIYDTEIKITEEAVRNSSAKIIPENCVIVAMYGATAGKAGINKIPLTTNQACCNLQIDPQKALYKYVFYWVCNEYENIKALGQGSQNNINAQIVKDYPIPVPPLPVQEEIVKILDAFASYTAELEAELEARKKQYEYYRDNLLSFEGRDDVEWKKLGDVCIKTDNIKWKSATCSYQYIDLSSVDIQTHSIISTTEIDRESAPSRAQQIVKTDDVIFATTRPTQMRVCLIPTEYDGEICSTGYCVLRSQTSLILPKYLFFALAVDDFKVYLSNNLTMGNYPSISNNTLKEYELPVPSLAEQQRIVDILDRFDTITNDLTSGLPAEIEKRRRQYEYYRDKLLTFKRKES